MDKKQPEAIRIAEWLEGIRGNTWPSYIPQEAAAELRSQHAEIETLRAGYDAARLEIASLRERVQMLGKAARDVNSRRVQELEAQLAAVGAGGVEPLRKRCLHQISEPVQPLVCDYCGALTPDPWHSSGMLHGKMSKHIHSCDACAAQGAAQAAPVGMEPTARIRYERNTPGRENEMPRVLSCNRMADGVYEVFTASQVQAMLAAAPRNAALYNPDDVAFPVQRCADGVDALPPELASTAKPASTAAMEVVVPIAPAREPLTDEQIDEIHLANSDAYERGDVEYESHGFARAIEHHHGITAAQKGGQHGF